MAQKKMAYTAKDFGYDVIKATVPDGKGHSISFIIPPGAVVQEAVRRQVERIIEIRRRLSRADAQDADKRKAAALAQKEQKSDEPEPEPEPESDESDESDESKETAKAVMYTESTFDWPYLLPLCVDSWSYEVDMCKESVLALPPFVYDWAKKTIVQFLNQHHDQDGHKDFLETSLSS